MHSTFRKLINALALGSLVLAFTLSTAQKLYAQAGSRAATIKVWTCDICTDDLSKTAAKELKPLTLVAAKNGAFSGKIVLESTGTIRGAHASVSALSGPAGTIATKDIEVRYGKWWDEQGWALPSGPDILLDTAPEVPPTDEYLRPAPNGRAILPVWVTVHVPKDAKPGDYSGLLTVAAAGLAPTNIPIKLQVENWTLPAPQNYRTWMDFVESPDTLALEYKTPLWSDKHWDLIAQSFRLIADTGSRVLYVPLICQTNFGNEQSMVRWTPVGDNRYQYDFSVFDKYMDAAEKNLGHPKLVVFLVWDICLSKNSLNRGLWGGANDTRQAREELLNKGPRVTSLDPKTKEAKPIFLPRYEDAAASRPLWQPLWTQLRQKMAARGLDKTMMLGVVPDLQPDKQEVAFWNTIAPGTSWVIHGHAGAKDDTAPGNKSLQGIAGIGYAAYVYNLTFNVNPDKGRMYGWRDAGLNSIYLRNGELNEIPLMEMREFPAFQITGGQRGCGRLGADYWPVLTNKKGQREGEVFVRYPENNWRNLDLINWFLAPGPTGPLATARLLSLQEGIQECEARIFLESALLDPGEKARLGTDLAKRCQDALDEHHHAMWKTVWDNDEDLAMVGKASTGRNPQEGLWQALVKAGKKLPTDYWHPPGSTLRSDEAAKGQAWFLKGWQDREKKLFALSGEAAAKLGLK